MKKLLALAVSVLLMVLVAVPAFAASGETSLVTGVEGAVTGELRNDYGEFVGMQIEMTADVTVTSLGRYFAEGNIQKHIIKIVDVETLTDVASVEIDLSTGTADSLGFKYAALQTPVTLTAGKKYYIASNNIVGGDKWYGALNLPQLTTTDVVSSDIQGVYVAGAWNIYQPGCYIPLNLMYTTGDAAAATTASTSAENPKTGDVNSLIYLALAAVSGAGMVAAKLKKK